MIPEKALFGIGQDGQQVYAFTLRNEQELFDFLTMAVPFRASSLTGGNLFLAMTIWLDMSREAA